MADHSDVSSMASAAINSVVDSFQHLPASTPSAAAPRATPRRKKNVHEFLGGGRSADVLLWKEKHISIGLLVGATVAWFLFEWSGYTLLSLFCNVLLFLVVILFVWANIAALLNRPPPPIPEIVLTEEMVYNFASTLRVEINKALAAAHDVAIGKDFRVFLKVVVGLWILSILGGWFNFITLVYILVVGAHTLPVLYDKYQVEIENLMSSMFEEAKKQYSKVDAKFISRIPRQEKKGL